VFSDTGHFHDAHTDRLFKVQYYTGRDIAVCGGNIMVVCNGTDASGSGIATGYALARAGGTLMSTLENLAVCGGNITAMCSGTGAYLSGIGSGYAFAQSKGTPKSTLVNLAITGGNITADCTGSPLPGSAIRPGSGGTVDHLRLSGHVTVRSPLLMASSILLSDGGFVFMTDAVGLLSRPLSSSGTVDLAILYSTMSGDDSQAFLR
jgi:hypothetical protein